MAEFITKCPHCSAELQAQDEWVGMEVECPECQNTFVVPKKKTTQLKKNNTQYDDPPIDFTECFGGIAVLIGIPLLLYWLLDWPRTVFWCSLPVWGVGLLGLAANKRIALAAIVLAGIIYWGWDAHTQVEVPTPEVSSNTADSSSGGNNSATNKSATIVFITNISNGYGRISPAMMIPFSVGAEDDKLNDMVKAYHDANKQLIYKQQTQETNANDEGTILGLILKIMNYMEANSRVMEQTYTGNRFDLTGVPVGSTLYCTPVALWNNGKHRMWWVKKIVVKPGENQIILENDSSAFQKNNN